MPPDTVDVSVGGERSFAQTLRHLVMATDTWLGRAILEIEQPFHPHGQPNSEYETDGNDTSLFTTVTPPYAHVLEVRAGRVAMVRNFLATVTPEELSATRKNPHNPDYQATILSCLHVILQEEWEYHRYTVRDIDATSKHSPAAEPGAPAAGLLDPTEETQGQVRHIAACRTHGGRSSAVPQG